MLTKKEIQEIIEKAENQKKELEVLIKSLENVEVQKFGRVKNNEIYWFVNYEKLIDSDIESGHVVDNERYECGNYYLTKEDAIISEKQIRLFRLLDRFSRQNGWSDELWKNSKIAKYYIYFDNNYKSIKTESVHISRYICQVYFVSESVAQQAIEKYHDLIMEVMAI